MVELWSGLSLDAAGVAAALAGAGAYALYLLVAERGVRGRDPVSLVCFGFMFAALAWSIFQPWWSFPHGVVWRDISLHGRLAAWHLPVWGLMAWMIVLGTIIPFGLLVGALRHIPATRAAIVAMLEPVVATVVAYAWLDESLTGVQIAGGLVVLSGIFLAQSAR